MTHLIKDAFYKEKLYQLSLTSFSQADTMIVKEKSQLKELSKQELPIELLEQCLSNFGKTAEGPHYSYLSFICSNQNIYSVAGLEKFRHLQHIDISHNNILTLKPFSMLRFLVHLNCSHNRLTKLLDFKTPPLQLMHVDSSFNEISVIPDISVHRFLKYLDLSHNKIEQINGIINNKYLQVLSLSNNQIENIENLDELNLIDLNLCANRISLIQGMTKLPKLRKLDLSQNTVSKLKGLIDLLSLRELRLSDNKVSRIKELSFLENLVYLSVLDFCFNSIQERRYYRMQVLYRLPGLRNLDGVHVIPEDVVKAENLYGQDLEDRKRIFKEILPEEEFIDRRIHISEVKLIEPETESDNEDREFVDQYDQEGNLQKTLKSIKSHKSIKSNN